MYIVSKPDQYVMDYIVRVWNDSDNETMEVNNKTIKHKYSFVLSTKLCLTFKTYHSYHKFLEFNFNLAYMSGKICKILTCVHIVSFKQHMRQKRRCSQVTF